MHRPYLRIADVGFNLLNPKLATMGLMNQTFTLGQSIQADNYRIRLTKARFTPPSCEIEI
jgi:hypothetical protein